MMMTGLARQRVRHHDESIAALEGGEKIPSVLFLDVLDELTGPYEIECPAGNERPRREVVEHEAVRNDAVALRFRATVDSQHLAAQVAKVPCRMAFAAADVEDPAPAE